MSKVLKKSNWEKFEHDYVDVINDYNLKGLTKQSLSDQLINIAESIQHEICAESDSIKIGGLEQASELMGVGINRGDWCTMVGYGVRSNNANTDKLVENINNTIDTKNFINNVSASIRSSVKTGNSVTSLPIPSANLSYIGELNTQTIPELDELYTNCVKTRTHINKVLYKEYTRISKAFQYLYKGTMSHAEFKVLVDDQVYANGGYPSENTPPRTWSKINKFRELIDAMYKAGKSTYINDYLKQFGIEIKISENNWKKWV